MTRRDHRGMHPRLDRAVVVLGDCQQLDGVAEFAGVIDIGARNAGDAFRMYLLRLQQHAECQGHQQAEFVRGVMTADIETRIGLRQTAALRLFEGVANSAPLSVIMLRIELQVPLTMPYTAR